MPSSTWRTSCSRTGNSLFLVIQNRISLPIIGLSNNNNYMSTLADPAARAACRERIQRLVPTAPAKWGRMTAPQMICHLNDSFRVALGEKYASPAGSFLQRTFIKWVALRTPVRWPPGVPTRPEIEQGRGGTPPVDWASDCSDLLGLI